MRRIVKIIVNPDGFVFCWKIVFEVLVQQLPVPALFLLTDTVTVYGAVLIVSFR
jgi:hypothetical protein